MTVWADHLEQEIKMLTVKDRFLMTAPPRGIKVVNPPIEIDARRMLELPSAGTLPVAHAALRAWYNKDQVATKDETWSSELDAARRNTNAAALLLAYRPFHLPPRPVFWTLNELSFESAAQAATFFEADLSRIWLILRFNIRLSETRAQGSLNLAMRYLSFGHMEPLDRCGKVFFLCHVRCVLTGGTKRYLGMIDPFREVRQKFRSPSLLDYRDGVSRRSLISTIGISLDDLKVKDLLILNRRNVNPVAPLVVFALQNRMHDLCTGRVSYVNPYKDACYISYDREEQRNWQSHYYELHDYVMSRWRTHGKMIHVHQDLDTGFS
jgi:hypothetical protein